MIEGGLKRPPDLTSVPNPFIISMKNMTTKY
jgi:hypothetical protein